MKVLLTTLNAKFIHSSLALAYLEKFCSSTTWEIEVKEYTINEPLEDILADMHMIKPDIVCFSCYIWNIEAILSLCNDFKSVNPDIPIVLGGPEVSYDAAEVLNKNPIDFVIRGEGEKTLKELLEAIKFKGNYTHIRGLIYKDGTEIIENRERELISSLDMIPFPYKSNLPKYKNKTIYYESSRGCPFNCSYCLSSTIKGVRFFSLDRVKKDLAYLMENEIEEVKFVDRTFNCNEDRAIQIMQYILDKNIRTKFHFEIGADLISTEFLDFLMKVPEGIFDFEIGIQSTFTPALKAVNRTSDWTTLSKNIKKLIALGNIHIHLDLIAGLPHENFTRFTQSFNDVYNLKPDKLQLGFLKLLKGSNIKKEASQYGYIHQSRAPYQVLANHVLTYDELIKLSQVENLINRYYNTHMVTDTLEYIITEIFVGNAFAFFAAFSQYWDENDLFYIGHRREREYSLIQEFITLNFPAHAQKTNEILKYDYFKYNKSYKLPDKISSDDPKDMVKILNSILKDDLFVSQYIPGMLGQTIREMKKRLHLAHFSYNPLSSYKHSGYLLFVYESRHKASQIIDVSSYVEKTTY